MRALVLSGGASKGAFTAGVAQYLLRDKDMQFDLAVGNSTGSLVGGPALLGEYNYLRNMYISVENDDIFKNSFFGYLANILGLQDGPIYASMEPLHEFLKDYYLEKRKLERLLDLNKTLSVATANAYSGDIHFVSSTQVRDGSISQETFVKAILASCCEPVFTQPVRVFEGEDSEFKDDLFYDGGVKEFIPLEQAVMLGAQEVWAVSTHTLISKPSDWGRGTAPDQVSVVSALGWTIGTFLDEIARGDRYRAEIYCKVDDAKEEIVRKARQFGLRVHEVARLVDCVREITPGGRSLPELRVIRPLEPMHTSMEFDPAIMRGYLTQGQLAARRFFEEGAPLYKDETIAPWDGTVNPP